MKDEREGLAEAFMERMEALLLSQRCFLAAMKHAQEEPTPTTIKAFKEAWVEAWDCNERMAKIFDFKLKTFDDLLNETVAVVKETDILERMFALDPDSVKRD